MEWGGNAGQADYTVHYQCDGKLSMDLLRAWLLKTTIRILFLFLDPPVYVVAESSCAF